MKAIRMAKWGYIIASVLFCITGILLILYPEIYTEALSYFVGAFLVFYGAVKLIGYFSKDMYCLAFQFDLALGLLFLAVGILILLKCNAVILLLYFTIGIIVFTDGVFKLQTASDAKRFGLNQWWMITAAAVLTCILGLLLMINLFEGFVLAMTLTGITLFLEGMSNLCVIIYTVRIIKKQI